MLSGTTIPPCWEGPNVMEMKTAVQLELALDLKPKIERNMKCFAKKSVFRNCPFPPRKKTPKVRFEVNS